MQYNGTEHGLQNVVYALCNKRTHNLWVVFFIYQNNNSEYEFIKLTKHMKEQISDLNGKNR